MELFPVFEISNCDADACDSASVALLARSPLHAEPHVLAKDRLSLPLAPSASASSLLQRQRFHPESSYHYDFARGPREQLQPPASAYQVI